MSWAVHFTYLSKREVSALSSVFKFIHERALCLFTVKYSEVASCPYNSGASGIFPVGVVLSNPAVEYNVAAFSELSFAVRWQGRLSRG